jgi:hypothetical protein
VAVGDDRAWQPSAGRRGPGRGTRSAARRSPAAWSRWPRTRAVMRFAHRHQGCDWAPLATGNQPSGERRLPRQAAGSSSEMLRHAVGRGGAAEHAVPIDWMQALWPLVLRTSATATSAAEMTTHSNSMACCQPRRGYRRRACGRAIPRRGCRRARRGRWAAVRPCRTRIFSRAGISSSAASRLKMFSMEASLGSEPARPSSMEPRACLCGSLRLIIITSEAGA